jgi:hypothetical protein
MSVTRVFGSLLLSLVVAVIAITIRHQHRARGPAPDNAIGHTGIEALSGGEFRGRHRWPRSMARDQTVRSDPKRRLWPPIRRWVAVQQPMSRTQNRMHQ